MFMGFVKFGYMINNELNPNYSPVILCVFATLMYIWTSLVFGPIAALCKLNITNNNF